MNSEFTITWRGKENVLFIVPAQKHRLEISNPKYYAMAPVRHELRERRAALVVPAAHVRWRGLRRAGDIDGGGSCRL